ncbi:secretory phospholipase A2 receptor [Helicoverpa armigera]|uniref:secretory phospholipase A2 receptor n=1 Tax=Helicoverpa armigera TaxID=29058 RepID=UPI00308374D2
MITSYFICLSFLLIATDGVLSKPQYLFSYEAEGWLKLHKFPTTWEQAFLRCHYEGAVLASPLDAGLVNALRLKMVRNRVNGPIFLGAHNLHSGDDFVSIQGVPLSDMEINWAPQTYPDVSGLCLTMAVNGSSHYMNVTSCKDSLPYICYRKFEDRTMNECGTFDDAYHLNKRTGSCYKVHFDEKTWYHAYEVCAAEGGHLVVINNKEEALVIKDMFPARPSDKSDRWEKFHIGMRAYGGDHRTWVTLNGDRLEDVFNDWDPGQPDNRGGNDNYAAIIRPGTLDDGPSVSRAKFVCEKSPKVELFSQPIEYVERTRVSKNYFLSGVESQK